MKNFFERTDFEQSDIQELIANKAEESINLEFKSAESLSNNNKCKTELSKDISSFANSTGGIIIYGIIEADHTAIDLSFIDGNIITKEWIEQVINTRISKRISGITIHPIRFDHDISKSVYLIKIPESYSAPHMAHDNKYYKRYNFQVIPMLEYEVRNLYHKYKFPRLEILPPESSEKPYPIKTKEGIYQKLSYVKFKIKNDSYVTSEKCKMEILIPSRLQTLYNKNENIEFYDFYVGTISGFSRFCIHSSRTIFPLDSELLFGWFINTVDVKHEELKDIKIFVTLFYDGGRRSRKYSLDDIFSRIDINKNPGLSLLWSDLDI